MPFQSRSFVAVLALAAAVSLPAQAQKKYGPGATDTEIKLGQTMPYSGPASAYGAIGKAELAYFKMINDQGGINGRKVNLISLDDAYSARRARSSRCASWWRRSRCLPCSRPRHADQHR